MTENQHHIWCNYYMKPREGCRMCEDFFKRFPMTETEDMVSEHFPDATEIKQRQ